MESLTVDQKTSKTRRTIRMIVGLYFILFCGYFLFNEAGIDRYGILFFAAAVGTFLALLLFLSNTLWTSDKKKLVIDNSIVESKVPSSKFKIDWVDVSKVTIGVSYILFFIDGGKHQRKLDLSNLLYTEVGLVKSKVIELCEYKSISYIND